MIRELWEFVVVSPTMALEAAVGGSFHIYRNVLDFHIDIYSINIVCLLFIYSMIAPALARRQLYFHPRVCTYTYIRHGCVFNLLFLNFHALIHLPI